MTTTKMITCMHACMQAFIKAFRAGCDSAGPAKILVPPGKFMMGEVVLSGPCKAAKPLLIEIQGTLLANTDPSAYSNLMWILIEHVDTVKISGGGVLNGRGQSFWKYAGEDQHMPVVRAELNRIELNYYLFIYIYVDILIDRMNEFVYLIIIIRVSHSNRLQTVTSAA